VRVWFRTSFLVPVALALTVAAPAHESLGSEETGGEAPLEALVQEAVLNNPDLRAAAEAVTAAEARPLQAGALADPMLAFSYTNDGWGPTLGARDMTTLAVMASQDLPWPGKRSLRAGIAAREAEEVAAQLARARLSVAAAVRRAYHALQLARVRRGIAREQSALALEVEAAARARYAIGQGSQPDVLRALIEAARVGQVELEQRAEEAVRVAEINRLLGRRADAPVDTAPVGLRTVSEPEGVVLERLLATSPERAAARTAVERARLSVALARSDLRPDFTLQAGYMNRGGLDPVWQAGVGVRLPLSRARRRSALAEAEALLRAAQARVESVERQLRFRTRERLARLLAVEKIAALYEGAVVPQDRIAVEASLAGYQSGRAPFVSVLAAQGALYADRAALAQLHAAHGQLRATLEEASLDATAEMPGLPAMAGAAGMGTPAMEGPAMPRAAGAAAAPAAAMDR
jgi:cobalt-zinc-cadmium efflux system outer membrane protein